MSTYQLSAELAIYKEELDDTLVDCPSQLTLMTWICQLCSMTNTSEKYERTQQGNLLG